MGNTDPGAAPLVVITGPTGSGKGVVAWELARRLRGEIISLDSMKVYQGLDIGTAKPPLSRRRQVRYHLMDLVPPDAHFSVGDYLPLFDEAVDDIRKRGRRPIVCGGTALYLKSLLDGLFRAPGADWSVRSRLREEAARLGPEALHARLDEIDPAAARKLLPGDTRRIVRALEIFELTGARPSDSWCWGDPASRRFPMRLFALSWDRQVLYSRTDRRVAEMFEKGLLAEAQRLREHRPPLSRSASQCIGYKEIFDGLDRGLPHEEIAERIERNTRHLVKRQLTWFRKMPIEWIEVDEPLAPGEVVDEIIHRLETDE